MECKCYVLLMVLLVRAWAIIQWENSEYVRWSLACSFPGYSFENVSCRAQDCGSVCQSNLLCTHFAWTNHQNGTCFLHSENVTSPIIFENKAVPESNYSAVCGFLQIYWNDAGAGGVHWSLNCNFPGSDFEKEKMEGRYCGLHCQKTPSCTHFTWTPLEDKIGTCYLKNGGASKGQEKYSPRFVCGISDNQTTINEVEIASSTSYLLDHRDGTVLQDTVVIAVSVVLVAAFVAGIIGIAIKLHLNLKREIFQGALKLLKGNVTDFNHQKMSVEDQTEQLPYDERWEFPKYRLKLGQQLGVGCFGRVVKAEAVGIRGSIQGSIKTTQTVAVKMARLRNNAAALEALVSELKILIYLGSHLNILNLLGACTKQISIGELFVIVEYCPFGNLKSYLIKHRGNFINQVDEFGFGNVNLCNDQDDPDDPGDNNGNIVVNIPQFISGNPTIKVYPDVNADTNLDAEKLSTSKADSIQEPEFFSRYEQDPVTNSKKTTISTRDLISWAFQIARGMDYLTRRKVFHGDLAARNVLLADNGVVKVADFGMARRMYYESHFKKKEQGLMPIKWMALESLTDCIFSSESDVWSYGVLLWELFSLGKEPYPGLDSIHLIEELENGYRMKKPDFAPNFIGEILVNCWKKEAQERPSFSQLEEIVRENTEASVSSYYGNLNVPYEKCNEEKDAPLVKHFGLSKLLDDKHNLQESHSAPVSIR